MKIGFHGVPAYLPDQKEHIKQIAIFLNDQVLRGKVNVTNSITLTANATTTTLTDERIGYGTFIDLMPMTANAATAKAGVYYTNLKKGSATINHANSANVDQTFTVLLMG